MKISLVLSFVVLVMLCTEHVTCDEEDCVFPFTYKGRTYNSCTYADYHLPWCAYDRQFRSHRWDFCGCSDSEARRLNCSRTSICVPAVEGRAAHCYRPWRPQGRYGRR